MNPEMERFVQHLFGFEFHLFFVHLLAQVAFSSLVGWHQIDTQLSALLLLADDWQFAGVVEHVGEGFGGEEAASHEAGSGWVPEGVLFLFHLGDDTCLEVLLRHVFDDVVPVGEGLRVPPVAVPRVTVGHLDLDTSLLHVQLSLLFLVLHLVVTQHHLHCQCHVLVELLRN